MRHIFSLKTAFPLVPEAYVMILDAENPFEHPIQDRYRPSPVVRKLMNIRLAIR